MTSEDHPSDRSPFLRARNTSEGESSCGNHLHGLGSHGSSASSPACSALLRVMETLPGSFASVCRFALPTGGFDTEERKRNFFQLSFLFRKGKLAVLHSALNFSLLSSPLALTELAGPHSACPRQPLALCTWHLGPYPTKLSHMTLRQGHSAQGSLFGNSIHASFPPPAFLFLLQ